MTDAVIDETLDLLRVAREVYSADRAAIRLIDQLEVRLGEPLRLAIAGMVKAGKSTLLNAMLGERIAATDTGECTRIVTWYRHSVTPSITMHLTGGASARMPIRRSSGLLAFDLGGRGADEIDWIDVGWPLEGLSSAILIDTPGIASLSAEVAARTERFLTSDDAASSADAVIYLLRHLHGADVKFLQAFRDTAAGAAQSVCAVAVLSRADEVGSGRIDSLLSARRVALRYERDGDLAALALRVIPVAGLLAEGARTLRESEFIALRELAELARADREALLVSADRFVRPSSATGLSESVRQELLTRFGIFGVRLATALIRAGAHTSSALSESLVEQSGVRELQDFVRAQLLPRAPVLKARGVVMQVQALLRRSPREGSERVEARIERFAASAHALRELELLALARSRGLPVPPEHRTAAERILGGQGPDPRARLGLDAGATDADVAAAASSLVDRWRMLAAGPLASRETTAVCGAVVRSLEEVLATGEVGSAGSAVRALQSAPDVHMTSRPGDGPGHDGGEQGEQDERRLRREKWLQHRSLRSQRHPLR
ncbi:GTPase [Microbacterium sp. USHLN186]|uniref:GTPase n=1 Tax=Microbacterium sp. USHLN186 TaxID=3081286 RepID=UPI003017ECAC